jgi:hypothetical protein
MVKFPSIQNQQLFRMHFEYYGRTDLKDEILEVLKENWKKSKEDVEHGVGIMLYYQFYLDVVDVGFTSVPRDFNLPDYLGNYPNFGICVHMVTPCGSAFLLNLNVRCFDLYLEEFHFGDVNYEE